MGMVSNRKARPTSRWGLRCIRTAAGAVLLLHLAWPLAAQEEALEGRILKEQWVQDVAVSGGVRVGIMASPAAALVDPDHFTVYLPDVPGARVLCVEISSRDGRYSAAIEYDLTGVGAGPHRLGLRNAQYRGELGTYAQAELAVLARLREECGAPGESEDPFVVAGWGAERGVTTVTVLLNSRVPAEVVGEVEGRMAFRVPCSDLEGGTTTFNLRCDLDGTLLTPTTELYVVRRRGTRTLAPVALPLRLPR